MHVGKILYLIASSKPEAVSVSRTVARALVKRLMEIHPDASVEELNLYTDNIPRPHWDYFGSRSCLVSGDALKKLPLQDQAQVRRMESLCDQFISASIIVLAAPMWSLSFPGVVKDYLDCVIQKNKTIAFRKEKPVGLMGDRDRSFFYVQSSGGNIPWVLRPSMNKGLGYVEDIMRFLGFRYVDELLVDNTGTTDEEKKKAVEKAVGKIEEMLINVQLSDNHIRTGW